MCSLADVHRHLVANIITKNSTAKPISLLLFLMYITIIKRILSDNLRFFLLRNQLKWLHSDKQYRRTAPLKYRQVILLSLQAY